MKPFTRNATYLPNMLEQTNVAQLAAPELLRTRAAVMPEGLAQRVTTIAPYGPAQRGDGSGHVDKGDAAYAAAVRQRTWTPTRRTWLNVAAAAVAMRMSAT